MRTFSRFSFLTPDVIASLLSWTIFFIFRKLYIEHETFSWALLDKTFLVTLLLLPFFWIFIHWLSGAYTDVYRKSRVTEAFSTGFVTFLGVTVLFFTLLLDDLVKSYKDYYFTFLALLLVQYFFTFGFRFLVLFFVKQQFKNGTFRFPTLIIGNSGNADEVFEEIEAEKEVHLYNFVGFIQTNNNITARFQKEFKNLGSIDQIEQIIQQYKIEELIIAHEHSEREHLGKILNIIADKPVYVKIIPDIYDILAGTVRINHVIDEAFVEIPPQMMSEWEKNTKRVIDIVGSTAAILLLFPVMLFVAIRIKLDSPGPIFYHQERLGQYRRPFMIKKFRSMRVDAENGKPQLTQDKDDRITAVGSWIRKYRFDELPQFFNVLNGEMSIVGPRAERAFFADQLEAQVPYYNHIFKVKPGITSLGMVKYGYASNLQEMIKRMKYDILYIENMGLLMDIKILLFTVITVLTGRGK